MCCSLSLSEILFVVVPENITRMIEVVPTDAPCLRTINPLSGNALGDKEKENFDAKNRRWLTRGF
jgi:hypothetical protein